MLAGLGDGSASRRTGSEKVLQGQRDGGGDGGDAKETAPTFSEVPCSPLIRPFGPPSPRRGEGTASWRAASCQSLSRYMRSCRLLPLLPSGRRWPEGPDGGATATDVTAP